MYKNIVISVLITVLLMRHPWLASGTLSEQIAVAVGTAVVVFIFLLFLEEFVEKRKRIRKIFNIIKGLREGKP